MSGRRKFTFGLEIWRMWVPSGSVHSLGGKWAQAVQSRIGLDRIWEQSQEFGNWDRDRNAAIPAWQSKFLTNKVIHSPDTPWIPPARKGTHHILVLFSAGGVESIILPETQLRFANQLRLVKPKQVVCAWVWRRQIHDKQARLWIAGVANTGFPQNSN